MICCPNTPEAAKTASREARISLFIIFIYSRATCDPVFVVLRRNLKGKGVREIVKGLPREPHVAHTGVTLREVSIILSIALSRGCAMFRTPETSHSSVRHDSELTLELERDRFLDFLYEHPSSLTRLINRILPKRVRDEAGNLNFSASGP
jgi:hypothetical protein